MAVQRPPPFTPQQRIDHAFDAYPGATLDSWTRKIMQNPGYIDIALALRGPPTAADSLFAVPPQHLQQMAGNAVYPAPDRFLPLDPNNPSLAAQRYENTMKLGGTQALQLLGGQPPNVITLPPSRAIDKYLK